MNETTAFYIASGFAFLILSIVPLLINAYWKAYIKPKQLSKIKLICPKCKKRLNWYTTHKNKKVLVCCNCMLVFDHEDLILYQKVKK